MGVTTAMYTYTESLNIQVKLGMVGIPFKGDLEVVAAVMGMHVPVGMMGYPNAKIQADGG